MRIEVINRYFYPVAAGIEEVLLETYKLLSLNHKVVVHVSQNTLHERNILPSHQKIDNITVKRYPYYSFFGYFPKIDWNNVDVIHLNNFDVFPHVHILIRVFLLKIIGRKKVIVVLSPHGGFTPAWSTFPLLVRFLKLIHHLTLGTFLINHAVDAVHAVSVWEKDKIVSYGVQKNLVYVVPNGVSTEHNQKKPDKIFMDRINKIGKYFVQIGRIHPIKNQETAIYALSLIPKDISFVIAGPVQDQKYLKYLNDLIDKLRLKKRVHFVGVVRGAEKIYLLKKASLMVHLALWENFCNVINEALDVKLFCIVANNTNLPNLIKSGQNGYAVETKNYRELAHSIQHFFVNQNEFKKKFPVTNKNISWKRATDKMLNLFEILCRRIHGPVGIRNR